MRPSSPRRRKPNENISSFNAFSTRRSINLVAFTTPGEKNARWQVIKPPKVVTLDVRISGECIPGTMTSITSCQILLVSAKQMAFPWMRWIDKFSIANDKYTSIFAICKWLRAKSCFFSWLRHIDFYKRMLYFITIQFLLANRKFCFQNDWIFFSDGIGNMRESSEWAPIIKCLRWHVWSSLPVAKESSDWDEIFRNNSHAY